MYNHLSFILFTSANSKQSYIPELDPSLRSKDEARGQMQRDSIGALAELLPTTAFDFAVSLTV